MKPTALSYGFSRRPFKVIPGDQFILGLNGKEVHRVDINKYQTIEVWICADFGGIGIGYIIGQRELLSHFDIPPGTPRIDIG